MQKIATVTVGAGGAASITFSSIPQTYTDLVVLFSARTVEASATSSGLFSLNGSTANFTDRALRGDGSGTLSLTGTGGGFGGSIPVLNGDTSTANTFSNAQIYIPNYAGSTNKSFSIDVVQENNASSAFQFIVAGLWSNTSAITSLSLFAYNTNLKQGTTASLYGILKGSGGATAA